ncbi:MAG: aspartyl protease family protein [Armatimonas sp.]
MARSQEGGEEGHDLIGMDLLKQHCLHFQFRKKWVSIVDSKHMSLKSKLSLNTDKAWHPYVDVDMTGSNGQAVWDTGASITVVDKAFIAANPGHFSQIGTSKGTDASGKTMETPLMVMKVFQIAGQSFPTQRVASVDLSFANKGTERRMDMILGYNTMQNADWLFDFPNKQWAITKMHRASMK